MEEVIRQKLIDENVETELALNCPARHAVTTSARNLREQFAKRANWKRRALQLQREIYVAYFVFRHPDVPWYSKFLAAVAVGYVISPIQLIPTFIPLVGVLDDLLVLVVAIKVMRRITPDEALAECRTQAESARSQAASGILKHAAIGLGVLSALIGSFMAWGCTLLCHLTGR